MPATTTKNATGRFFSQSLPAMSTQGRDPDQQRRGMRVAQVPEEVAHPLPEVAVGALEAEQLGQLRAGQIQREAGLEADEHGLGEEADGVAGANQPGRERDRRDQQRRARRQRRMPRGIAPAQPADRRADQQRQRRRDGDDRLLRAAEEPEDEPENRQA